ncbi:nucleoside phosphorylase [Portibacter marinus]|uniref:nucleoside phosphorylase n=1 Tax=Portibacter marinus TaxID=2898660 RepID=UPI001F36A99F|nr:nucleoside phosphorylase [Portibacter marinus]
MGIAASELILNDDGSVYHLNLLPGDVANTIITVGDQERVGEVSKYFDRVELKKSKREFTCHTGWIGSKRISVISTGIGTDNIDIVFNEIDALFNVNLETREVREKKAVLDFIRLGTSGSLSNEVALGSVVVSEVAVGIDHMNYFYRVPVQLVDTEFEDSLRIVLGGDFNLYSVKADVDLASRFLSSDGYVLGKTLTSIGFYGPQGRSIRNELLKPDFIDQIARAGVTNLEMETSGIYLLAGCLGHRAISINAILANRRTGDFAKEPAKVVDDMIKGALEVVL